MHPDRELHYPLQRILGAFFVVGGLWHAASPWIQRFSEERAAVVSCLISGLALAAVGACVMIVRGGRLLTGLAAAIGVWVMVAPAILGVGNWMMLNEAYWGGPLTLVLAAIAAYDLRFHRSIDEEERAALARAPVVARPVDPAEAERRQARARESRLRFVPTAFHAAVDYLWAAALIAMPWVLGERSMFAVAIAPLFVGLFVIFYSVFTEYEYGFWGVLTMRDHLWLDFGTGLFLALSPWIFGFAGEMWIPHVAFGAFAMLAAIVTSTVPQRPVAPLEWFPRPQDYPLASH
jgi:hypothetical protein